MFNTIFGEKVVENKIIAPKLPCDLHKHTNTISANNEKWPLSMRSLQLPKRERERGLLLTP